MTKETIDQGMNLSLIIRAGAGVNTIDLEEASTRGIHVANCPGKNSDAVAELAMGLIIAADQLTKALIVNYLPLHSSISVIPGFFNLTHINNPGGAFGFLATQSSLLRDIIFLFISSIIPSSTYSITGSLAPATVTETF